MHELVKQLATMTQLVTIKYGNLHADVYAEILKAEKMVKDYERAGIVKPLDYDGSDCPENLHRDEYNAFDMIDAAIFTGCPSDNKDKLGYFSQMFNRWGRELASHIEEPLYLVKDEDDA